MRIEEWASAVVRALGLPYDPELEQRMIEALRRLSPVEVQWIGSKDGLG